MDHVDDRRGVPDLGRVNAGLDVIHRDAGLDQFGRVRVPGHAGGLRFGRHPGGVGDQRVRFEDVREAGQIGGGADPHDREVLALGGLADDLVVDLRRGIGDLGQVRRDVGECGESALGSEGVAEELLRAWQVGVGHLPERGGGVGRDLTECGGGSGGRGSGGRDPGDEGECDGAGESAQA